MSTLTPPEETGLRAVVAEDETLIRLDLVEVLTGAGYRVVAEAGDGRAAVEAVREHRPDIVVMDVKMPVMDGIAAAGEIAGERLAPVVMLTAFSQRELVERARTAGAMAYVVKPFTEADLVPAIELAVATSTSCAASRPRCGTWATAWRPARSWTGPRRCSRSGCA